MKIRVEPNYITEKQIARFWAIANSYPKWDQESIYILLDKYNLESVQDIKMSEYKIICEILEGHIPNWIEKEKGQLSLPFAEKENISDVFYYQIPF